MNSIDNKLIELFRSKRNEFNSVSPSQINSQREDAIEKFSTYSLPTKKDESYKYSEISKWLEKAIEGKKVNSYRENGATFEQSSEGVVICNIETFASEFSDIFSKYYTKSVEDNSLMMLSRAFACGGKVVYVPRNTVCKTAITINEEVASDELSLGVRNIFIFERGSMAKLHINRRCDGVANIVSEIFIENDANVEISELIEGSEDSVSINTISSLQGANSFYKHISVNLSSGKVRLSQYASLAGSRAEVSLYGAVLAKGEAHLDNSTLIKHLVPNCKSYENFKTIANDKATSIFCGEIFVAAGAGGTEAYQNNSNILLSDSANIYSKPNLEIYADDVKCSHGATVGQLDAEALFYMRQRGISIEEGRKLMLKGFLKDIVIKISDEQRVDYIDEKL